MKQERLTTIWSLHRRAEVLVRIYYRVEKTRACRVLRLQRVEEFSE